MTDPTSSACTTAYGGSSALPAVLAGVTLIDDFAGEVLGSCLGEIFTTFLVR